MILIIQTPSRSARCPSTASRRSPDSSFGGSWWVHTITVELAAGASAQVRVELAGAPARPGRMHWSSSPAARPYPERSRSMFPAFPANPTKRLITGR